MFSQLCATVSLALLAAASPIVVRKTPISVPLARRFNATGASNVLASDQARARFLKSGGIKSVHKPAVNAGDVPVTNGAVIYTAAVRATQVVYYTF